MAEYIDKQAFNDAIRKSVRKYPSTFYNGLEVARQIACELPAADVAPVRQGRWIRHRKKEDGKYYEWCNCSECGNEATAGPCYWDNETPFCPWCGAKMDGGEGNGKI